MDGVGVDGSGTFEAIVEIAPRICVVTTFLLTVLDDVKVG